MISKSIVILKKHGPTIVCSGVCKHLQTRSQHLCIAVRSVITPYHFFYRISVLSSLTDAWSYFTKLYMERLMLKMGTNVCIFPYFSYQFFPSFQAQVLPWPVRFSFFSRRTWTPRISTSCCCSISMRLTKTGPRKLESNSSRWHLGYGELESNSTWWHTYIYIYIFIIYTTYIYIPHPGCNCGIERFCLGFPRFLTWHSGWGLHPRFALLGTDTIPYQPALLRSCQGVEVLESIPVSVRVGPRKTAVGWPSQSFPPSTCPFFFEKVQGTSDFK